MNGCLGLGSYVGLRLNEGVMWALVSICVKNCYQGSARSPLFGARVVCSLDILESTYNTYLKMGLVGVDLFMHAGTKKGTVWK